jgi:hypothetical protein
VEELVLVIQQQSVTVVQVAAQVLLQVVPQFLAKVMQVALVMEMMHRTEAAAVEVPVLLAIQVYQVVMAEAEAHGLTE